MSDSIIATGLPHDQQSGIGSGPLGILTDSEYRLFKDLIYEECGVCIGMEKRVFLESRLRRRMDDLGIASAYEYYCLLRHFEGRAQELPELLDILMICETSFFRNQPQFDLLRDAVLPEVVTRKWNAGSRLIRIWTAGCSTGQEPYSIAIGLLEWLPDPDSWSIRVLASDLSFTALEQARRGIYKPDQVKSLDTACVAKYFKEVDGNYVIADSVKRSVAFDYHNLKYENGLRSLDMIFCRNVMIYFDTEEQRRLVSRFSESLVPGGYLFLGHAESLQGLSSRFAMVHRNKGIAYRFEG
jgi:chemotaxis protein methyltransferase CheR